MSTLKAPAPAPRPPAPGRPGRAPAEAALLRARELAPRPSPEWVPLGGLAGRRLAADVAARHDLPSADASAMDGWAVRAADGRAERRVAGESAAGHVPGRRLGPGEACRVSTGALLPAGADAVLRREHGREAGGRLLTTRAPRAGDDVRPRGDDVPRGRVLLRAGTVVAAHEVGVVAAAGHSGAHCLRRLRVAVMTTGDELVAPDRLPARGEAVESNLAGLAAQARAAGADLCASAHAPDDPEATRTALSRLLAVDPDVLVTVGGISLGVHDHVAGALAWAGAAWAVRGVAMRPGHPVGIAVRGAAVVLALPGNPAAAAVCFHLLGRVLLGVGDDWARRSPLAAPVARHPRDTVFARCAEDVRGALPLERQGPAQVTSLAGARLLAWIPPGRGEVPPGRAVAVSVMP